MAESSDYLIRIVVKAMNQAGNFGDKVAGQVDKIVGAESRQQVSARKTQKSIEDLDAASKKHVEQLKEDSKTKAKLADEAEKRAAKNERERVRAEAEVYKQLSKIEAARQKESDARAKVAAKEAEARSNAAAKSQEGILKNLSALKLEEQDRTEKAQKASDARVEKERRDSEMRGMSFIKSAYDEHYTEKKKLNARLDALDAEEHKARVKRLTDEAVAVTQGVQRQRSATDHNVPAVISRAVPTGGSSTSGFSSDGAPFMDRLKREVAPQASIFQRIGAALRGAGSEAKKVDRDFSGLERSTNRLGHAMNRSSFSVAKVDNNLRGLMVIGIIAFSQQFISALVGVAGAATAVASSAVQAGAALGGAFVAAGAQALPVIGLLISAFGRLQAVFKAVKLFNLQQTKAGYDQSQVGQKQADAADRITSAQEQVASATQRVRDATDALTTARERALRNIQDLDLAERRASRGKFDAATALQRAASSGDLGALEGLQIQKDSAGLDASRAKKDDRRSDRAGVSGSDEVKQSQQALKDANNSLRTARRELEAAQRSAISAAKTSSFADRNLEQALAQLTPAERALFESAKRIQKQFRAIFRPITDIIVTAFSGAVERVTKIMGDDRIVKPITNIAQAIGDSIGRITRFLTDAKGLNFFKSMGDEAARNIPLLTTLAIRLGQIFRNIATAGGPALREFIKFFIDLATQGAKATGSESGLEKLRKFFLQGERMAESIVKLGLAFAGLFLAIIGQGGAKSGQMAIDDLTKSIQRATNWINDHGPQVRKFFSDAMKTAYALAGSVWEIGKALVSVFDASKVLHFTEAFNTVLLPALTVTIGALGSLTNLMLKFLDLPVVGNMAKIAIEVGLVGKAISTLGNVVKLVFGSKLLTSLFSGLTRLPQIGALFVGLRGAMAALAAFMTGGWGLAIAAVVISIVLLDQKLHFLKGTFSAIGSFFSSAFHVAGLTSSIDKVNDSEKKLAKTQADSAKAQRDLTASRQEASRKLDDLASAASGGKLDVRSARFSLQDEEKNLGSLKSSGAGKNQIDRAQLSVDQARKNLKDTTRQAARAEDEYAAAKRNGIKGDADVVAAEKSLKNARYKTLEAANAAARANKENDQSIKDSSKDRDGFVIRSGKSVIRFFKDTWNHGILFPVKQTFADVYSFLKIAWDLIHDLIKGKSNSITDIFTNGPFSLLWKYLSAPFRIGWELVQGIVTTALDLIRGDFKGAAGDFAGIFKSMWRIIGELFKEGVATALNTLSAFLGGFSSVASFVGDLNIPVLSDLFKGGANAIDGARKSLDGWANSLRSVNDEHKTSIKSTGDLISQVTSLRTKLRHLDKGSQEYRDTAEALRHKQRQLNDSMGDAEEKGKKGAKGPRAIGSSARSAANAVDDANKIIVGGYNKLGEQLGGIKKLTYAGIAKVAILGDDPEKRATGGYGWIGGRRGGPQGPDNRHVLAGDGEAFLAVNQQGPVDEGLALRSMVRGGPSNLDELFSKVRGQVGSFATGGRVDGLKAGIAALVGKILAKFPGLSVTSTTGGTHAPGSYHYRGLAADLGGNPDLMNRAASWLAGNAKALTEGIHNPGLSVKDGVAVPSSFWGATTWAGHMDHIHVAVAGLLGALKGGAGGLGALKTPRISGPQGKIRDIAQKAVSRLARAARHKLDSAGAVTADEGRFPSNSGNTQQIRRWIAEGLSVAGQKVTPAAISTLLGRVMQESGGNPNAINNTDINAQRGDPSKGILQTISATFNAFKVRGHNNIFNPIDNIAAAVRYMLATYHHLVGAGPGGYSTGGRVLPGYAAGGELPGPLGRAVPILAHAKEWVLNEGQKSKLAGWMGVGVDHLRGMLGLSIGASSAAAGTEVKSPKGTYMAPTIVDQSESGISAEIRRAQATIRRMRLTGTAGLIRFTRSLEQITDDGGLVDQGLAAIQRVFDRAATKLKKATYHVGKSSVVNRLLSPAQQNAASLSAIDDQIVGLRDLRGTTASSLSDVDRRLAAIRKGHVSKKERKNYEALVFARRGLQTKLDNLDTGIADAVQSRFAAQEQVLQDTIDDMARTSQRALTRADLGDRVAALVQGAGDNQTAFAIRGSDIQARISAQTTQRDALGPLLARAQAQGSTQIAEDLVGQIEELNVSIAENVAALGQNTIASRQAGVDAVNKTAARALAGFDIADRVATVMQNAGNSAGAFALRGSTLSGRGSTLTRQRDELSGYLASAMQNNDGSVASSDQINDLIGQIEDLNTSIAENISAVSSNTVAARQAAIDSISGRGSFLGGVFSNLGGIIQTIGAITGSVDVAQLVSLAKQGAEVLSQTGEGLKQQLLGGFGVDLVGKRGQGLVDALRGLNFDNIEASFTPEQKQQFEILIASIIDNEGALQQNTQQIKDLGATQEQSFSSSAWQLFRQAIFNGSGGLLPAYNVPMMETGGGILSGGLTTSPTTAINTRSSSQVGGDHIEVNVTSPTEVLDPGHVADVISFRRSTERAV